MIPPLVLIFVPDNFFYNEDVIDSKIEANIYFGKDTKLSNTIKSYIDLGAHWFKIIKVPGITEHILGMSYSSEGDLFDVEDFVTPNAHNLKSNVKIIKDFLAARVQAKKTTYLQEVLEQCK